MNISNISAERFLLEISTNTICRELFFFNKQEVINAMEPYSKDWFENLTYAQCNKHAICIIKKLEDEVCKYYLIQFKFKFIPKI